MQDKNQFMKDVRRVEKENQFFTLKDFEKRMHELSEGEAFMCL